MNFWNAFINIYKYYICKNYHVVTASIRVHPVYPGRNIASSPFLPPPPPPVGGWLVGICVVWPTTIPPAPPLSLLSVQLSFGYRKVITSHVVGCALMVVKMTGNNWLPMKKELNETDNNIGCEVRSYENIRNKYRRKLYCYTWKQQKTWKTYALNVTLFCYHLLVVRCM